MSRKSKVADPNVRVDSCADTSAARAADRFLENYTANEEWSRLSAPKIWKNTTYEHSFSFLRSLVPFYEIFVFLLKIDSERIWKRDDFSSP